MTRLLHISHTDLDGYGCQILTRLLINSLPNEAMQATYENIQPGRLGERIHTLCTTNELAENYDRVIITDLNITKEIADNILSTPNPEIFRIFDHHVTPFLEDGKYWEEHKEWEHIFCITSEDPINHHLTCGTELYYEYIHSIPEYDIIRQSIGTQQLSNIAYFADTIREWDIWGWQKYAEEPMIEIPMEDLAAPRLNKYFWAEDREKFIAYCLDYITSNELPYLGYSTYEFPSVTDIVDLLIEKDHRYIEKALKRITPINVTEIIDGKEVVYKAGVIFAEQCISEVGSALVQQYPEYHFGMVIYNTGISLSSARDDVDVSVIARNHGGGGHPRSAGFSITPNQYKSLVAGYTKRILNYTKQN